MRKIKLPLVVCLLTFTAASQTENETFQTRTLDFKHPAESAALSLELNQKLDSIVIESFLPETEEWERVGKYKYGTEETATRKDSLFYVWNDSLGQWKSFPTEVWEYNEEGNLSTHVMYGVSILANGIDLGYKKESIFTYSDNVKQAEITVYRKDNSTGDLIPDTKEEITYNSEGKQLYYFTSFWDKNLEKWVFKSQYEYDYDENGFKTLDIHYIWLNDTEEWLGASKSEYEFDEKGNELMKINYAWNQSSKDWVESGKFEFAYDESGNVTERTYSFRDFEENTWIYYSREQYSFDIQGHLISQFYAQWDATQNVWVNFQKMEVEFDENFNETLKSSYYWSTEDSMWMGISRTEKEFDINLNLVATIEYQWEETLNQWKGLFKEKYDYDSLVNRTLTSKYVWSDADENWIFQVNRYLSEYEYDENGRIVKEIMLQWDEGSEKWNFANKNVYEYDDQGRQIVYENARWNYPSDDWENLTKTVNNFDETGNNILYCKYVWDAGLSDWRIRWEFQRAFDADGRQTLSSFLEWGGIGNMYRGSKSETNFNENGQTLMWANYSWDTNSGEWKGITKTEYTYDEYGRNLVILRSNWNVTEKKWQYYNRETYYYFTEIVQETVEIKTEINVKVYPNPAENYIRIQLPNPAVPAQLEFFNMAGQKMLSAVVLQGEQVALHHFKPGVYSYRLIHEQKIFKGKIVKK